MRKEFRFSGFGGQGVLTLGRVTGYAATIYDGYHVVQMDAYGPESRGGTSYSDVVIADSVIHSPVVQKSHVLVAMSNPAFDRFHTMVHSGGLILYESTMVDVDDATMSELKKRNVRVYSINALSQAESLGNVIVANTLILGVLTALDDTVSAGSMKKAVFDTVPPKTRELNEKAFDTGFTLGKGLKNEAV